MTKDLRVSVPKMGACACGAETDWACNDCRIDAGKIVHVCPNIDCQWKHETRACTRKSKPS